MDLERFEKASGDSGRRMRLDGSIEDFEADLKEFFREHNITEEDLENFDLDAFLEDEDEGV